MTSNIRYIYWTKQHPTRGPQEFFRPGLARNLASKYASGKYLVFLDSDMLVPESFIETAIQSMQKSDVIQFQRFHINQNLSKKNPRYSSVDLTRDTYIEESRYWSQLFFNENWMHLPYYWKYTCTYALGLTREHFYKLGLFKKYYVSYGFEDTDLGYEAHKNNLIFSLIKLPLLHLTAYDQMQYKNSSSRRFRLLKKTAELFYLQHLDPEIYVLLGNYYRFQKPAKSFLRDFISRF
jgi:glycosyltransferase involved in cell wall biosynthesis